MRKYGKIAAAAAMMIILAVQPVWADSPVTGTGMSGPGVSAYGPGVSENGPEGLAPGSSGNAASAGQAVLESPSGGTQNPGAQPGSTQAPAQSPAVQPESTQLPGTGAAGPADQGPAQSPVIVAGQSRSGIESGTQQQAPGTGTGTQQQAPGTETGALQPGTVAAGQPDAAQPQEEQALVPADAAQQPEQPLVPEEQPTEQLSAVSGRQIDPSKPMVALTFDDGPQASVGNRIMDCLAQYGGKATFFMVGERVPAHKTEVQRMVNEGHEVANHTMNHKYLQKLGAAEIQSQVSRCNDAIEAACGVRPSLMRLPGGNHNATVTANTHMPMIQWNIDTLDWKTRNADKTVQAVLGKVKDGDIVLMHELYSQTGDAALRIIPELSARGFQMVTVSEMAAAKGYDLQAGKLYSSFR